MSESGGTPGPVGTPVVTGASGANAVLNGTLPAVPNKTNYLSGFEITGGGATVGSIVQLNLVGLLSGTVAYRVPVPTGATLGVTPLIVEFNPPIPASGPNVAIIANLAAFGAGNTDAAVVAHGYVL